MNYRIKKKRAKPVIEICKQIQTDSIDRELYWNKDYPNESDYDFYYEYLYALQCVHEQRVMLYKIAKKAYEDDFPINNYIFFVKFLIVIMKVNLFIFAAKKKIAVI